MNEATDVWYFDIFRHFSKLISRKLIMRLLYNDIIHSTAAVFLLSFRMYIFWGVGGQLSYFGIVLLDDTMWSS